MSNVTSSRRLDRRSPVVGPDAVVVPDVLVTIRSLLPTLAPSERRVAEEALAHPRGTAERTISELARACRTSETTVVRFCRAVGLGGYPELRLALAAAGAHSSGDSDYVSGDITAGDDIEEIIRKVGYADARAVAETAEQVNPVTLAAVAASVSKAKRIDIYGVGASAFVALDLQQKLHRIGRIAFAWPDPHAALTSAALLSASDVAIAMSHTGTTTDTVDALTLARRSGALTVAITNYPRSSIADAAEHVLTTAARETTFRSGAMASRIAQLTLVDMLFVAVAQRSRTATVRALERTHEAVRSRH